MKHMGRLERRSGERGMAIIFYATMLFFVIGCVGLAVDVGTIYMIKARLSAAADGAALAAGRSVNLANTVAEATTNATTTADQFFTANFPNGYFNSIGTPTVTPTFTQETDGNGNPNGVLNIQVAASVSAPTYFMHMFNVANINVSATGTASRRGLVLMLVLDQSSSMGSGSGSPCEVMKTAAQNFITLLSPYDYVGLITFDYTAHLKDAYNATRTQVNTDIGSISCTNNTNTISALELAYQQIQAAGLPLALNSIVLFTDGSPNGVTANFPARTQVDNRWGPSLTSPAPPLQSGTTYGQTNSCSDVGPTDPNQAITSAGATVNEEAICVNTPVPTGCTNSSDTLHGTLVQWGDQSSWGGPTNGLFNPTDTDSVSYSGSCNPGGSTGNIRQYIAYIPQYDIYGNDLYNACGSTASCPAATGTSSYGTIVGGYDTRRYWLFQMNWTGSSSFSFSPQYRNEGGTWVNNGATGGVGSGSNFFSSGPYSGYMRPDQPNTIVAASMNGAMSEAYRIRSDAETSGSNIYYHTTINTIYLVGNATDGVDREFLAIVANARQITALPYDTSFTNYANPVYQSSQETGQYFVTADRNSLAGLFAQLASEILRLSQ
jgi:Flp pilus assembly protein TadG